MDNTNKATVRINAIHLAVQDILEIPGSLFIGILAGGLVLASNALEDRLPYKFSEATILLVALGAFLFCASVSMFWATRMVSVLEIDGDRIRFFRPYIGKREFRLSPDDLGPMIYSKHPLRYFVKIGFGKKIGFFYMKLSPGDFELLSGHMKAHHIPIYVRRVPRWIQNQEH